MDTNIVLSHIEKHLGKISSSWMVKDDSEHIQIIKFKNAPQKSVSTFVTFGLSHHVLSMPSGKECRQELLFSACDEYNSEDITSMLIMFSKLIIMSHRAVLRGGIEHVGKSIIPNVKMSYLFASIPFIFAETFDLLKGTNPPVMFPLLIPLHYTEVDYISKYGRVSFEKMLEEKDPDIFDLNRSPVV